MDRRVVRDGNEACADVAYRLSEAIAIYPITPASPMGELADAWSTTGRENLFGLVPRVVEMQSEGGAAGAVHGALQAGALTTTFTASQGLLLMLPNMYKIAGELTPTVFHIAARSIATHALSIFGDHSDVMSARGTDWMMLASGSVQEAHDLALVAHAATLRTRIPVLHFFDGFRTSHEINTIAPLEDDDLIALVDRELIRDHRARSLDPDRPVLRGTAQNPDVFFQAREAINPWYDAAPGIVQTAMDQLGERTGRAYRLFDYDGHPEAEQVAVIMGSGAGAVRQAVRHMAAAGRRVGAVTVRLYRPFDVDAFVEGAARLDAAHRRPRSLQGTRRPRASPLYQDVVGALAETRRNGTAPPLNDRCPLRPLVEGVHAVDGGGALRRAGQGRAPSSRSPSASSTTSRTSSLTYDREALEARSRRRRLAAVFYGLGSDGTVGSNKSSAKIIGERTDLVRAGVLRLRLEEVGRDDHLPSQVRPAPDPTRQLSHRAGRLRRLSSVRFLERVDVFRAPAGGDSAPQQRRTARIEVWDRLPHEVQSTIIERDIEALRGRRRIALAARPGLGKRINTVMQTCFFALSGVLPDRGKPIAAIRDSIERNYGKRGRTIVERNLDAVDRSLEALHAVAIPAEPSRRDSRRAPVPAEAPDFVQRVTADDDRRARATCCP